MTAKPSITFLHGWGVNQAVWHPLQEQLQATFEVTCLDLPGFGSAHDHNVPDYSFEHVCALIDEQILAPTILVGWSLGGLVASQLAIQSPCKIKALITVASSPCFIEKEGWPGISPDVLSSFHQQLSTNAQKTINNFLKIQAMGSPHIRDDIKLLRNLVMQYPIPNQQTLDDSLSLLESVDLRSEINKIKVPMYRMYGRLDGLVPKAVIALVDQLLDGNDDKLVMPKESHAPFISNADEFQYELLNWLKSKSLCE